MTDTLMRLYHRLPAPARSVAASMRGGYLRAWRYGPETDRLVAEARERDRWDAARWKAWQEERLAFVLHRAATEVPYYREQWAERRRRGDRASWEYVENWPVLPKDVVRQNPTSFVADDRNTRRMYHENTSGTTGKPLHIWWSRETVRAWFALCELRLREWNGVSRRDNWAMLGGQPVIPASVERPPFWVRNLPMRQLYLSSNHLSRKNTPHYIAALNRHASTHMICYASSAAVLAREAYEQGLRAETLKVVLTNAEPVFPWQREAIRQGLGCDVRETYGMAEIVTAASECPHGSLHLWPEVGWTEVLEDGEEAPSGGTGAGRLICTSLLNADMPLVRYEVGDRCRTAEQSGGLCACGRTLPLIAGIEGRVNDLLVARDGRRVYWLNPIFYGMPVSEAQIVQEELGRVRVRYVPAEGFTPDTGRTITKRLQSRMGDMQVMLEPVEQVPRGANGKFRAVVCNLSLEQIRLAVRAGVGSGEAA